MHVYIFLCLCVCIVCYVYVIDWQFGYEIAKMWSDAKSDSTIFRHDLM